MRSWWPFCNADRCSWLWALAVAVLVLPTVVAISCSPIYGKPTARNIACGSSLNYVSLQPRSHLENTRPGEAKKPAQRACRDVLVSNRSNPGPNRPSSFGLKQIHVLNIAPLKTRKIDPNQVLFKIKWGFCGDSRSNAFFTFNGFLWNCSFFQPFNRILN